MNIKNTLYIYFKITVITERVVVMIGAPNLRNPGSNGSVANGSRTFQCHPQGESEATITLTLVGLGIVANTVLMALIIFNKHLRR